MSKTERAPETPAADHFPPLPEDVSIEGMLRENYAATNERDIFSKVQAFTLAQRARELDLYPFFQPLDNNDGTEAHIYGQRVLMFGSNNYLGLTRHPHVVESARAALLKYGSSMTGSRLLNGTIRLHEELEGRIARFLRTEAAIVFTTGYQANLGIISTLVDKRAVAVVDKSDHASIYDGCQLADGEMVRFRHNDVAHLDTVLSRLDKAALVIIDGVYSMGGDIAPLPEILDVCQKYQARIVVDDAHGVGVLGEGGRGTAVHFGEEARTDIIMGTFSKSLASIGGFVGASKQVVDWVQHFSRQMLFSASLPPASTAAALAALDVLEGDPELPVRLKRLGDMWRDGLRGLGYDTGGSGTPIVPVNVGDEYRTVIFWKHLLDEGVYTNPAIYPAVNLKEAILRTSIMATHTEDQIGQALEKFELVGRRLGVIS